MNALLLAVSVALLLLSPWNSEPVTSDKPIEFNSHVVAACNQEPNQIEIRLQNLTGKTVLITGEIWANQNGTEVLISNVPEAYQETMDGNWGGPEERIENHFTDFTGEVRGWAEIRTTEGVLIGKTELNSTKLDCGCNRYSTQEFFSHVVAACGEEPGEIEIRSQNLITDSVRITGEIRSIAMGEENQIALVPPEQEQVNWGNWGGPEERIENHFTDFTGEVWGWTEIRTTEGVLIGKTELGLTELNCVQTDPQPSDLKIFLPMIVYTNDPVQEPSCDNLYMIVTMPGGTTTRKPFGAKPGPTYSFGDVFPEGSVVSFQTEDNQPVDGSYLGWFNSYTRGTGQGPKWEFRATGFSGVPPLLGVLYNWQAARTLPDNTECSIGFLEQWDPS